MVLLLALGTVNTYAVDCTSPGTGSSTDYPYDSAANTYVICSILSAQATIMAYTPTSTPTRTSTATPTTTPTLMPTAEALRAQTGCNPYDEINQYQMCIIDDAHTRADVRGDFWQPLIVITLIITAILRFKT